MKLGMLDGKRFIIGVNKDNIYEEGFTDEDMKLMVGWNDGLKNPVPEGYIQAGNIITSVSYGFVK